MSRGNKKNIGKHAKAKRKSTKKNSFFINIILIALIVTFIYSGFNVAVWLISDRKTKNLEKGLYSNITLSIDEQEKEDKGIDNVEINFEELKKTNPDIFAWIKIDNTYINYPILQGESDEYYLKKDIYKKYSSSGSIFVDSSTNTNFEDDNTVIYGHNMKNQRMFANLHKINNGSLGTDVEVKIYTEQGNSIYKVFSAYVAEPNEKLIKKNFKNENEKMEYINNAIQKSNLNYYIGKIDSNSKIITLMTCDTNNKNRLVIHAVKVN